MLMISVALALGVSERLPVSLDTRGEAESYRGALIQRFLEGQHVLVTPSTPRACHVTVRALRHSILVEVTCGAQTSSAEVDRTDESLMQMEVVHRAIDAVHRLASIEPEDPNEGRPVASLHFVDFTPSASDYEEASAPLLAQGFNVAGPNVTAHWVVCVWQREDGFIVERAKTPPCAATPPGRLEQPMREGIAAQAKLQATEDQTALLEEVMQTTLPEPDPPADDPYAARSNIARASPPPSSPGSRSTGWVTIHADGGAQWRIRDADPAIAATIGFGRRMVGGSIRAEILPWVTGDTPLTALDAVLAVGPSAGGDIGDRLHLRAHLLIGPMLHRYRWQDESVGYRLDAQVSIPVLLDVRLVRGLGLHAGVVAALSTRSRSHLESDDQPIEQRSALRLGVLAGLHYKFDTGGRLDAGGQP
ncbi:MAG: hypothetical protein AAGF11_12935 [Myxococcota bacterium]